MAVVYELSSKREIQDILIADIVLILAFSLTITGGLAAFQGGGEAMAFQTFIYYLPIAAVGVSLSFILHELMHKFVAQHYGFSAEFRTSFTGLAITLVTGAFGFLVGIPGATMIYTNSIDVKQNGIISLAGPLTNFIVFAAFLLLGVFAFGTNFIGILIARKALNSYLFNVIDFTIFISILLAFFNMLPIYPLDGSKVLKWSVPLYILMMAVIFTLMLLFTSISIIEVIFLIGIALVFSLFASAFFRFAF